MNSDTHIPKGYKPLPMPEGFRGIESHLVPSKVYVNGVEYKPVN